MSEAKRYNLRKRKPLESKDDKKQTSKMWNKMKREIKKFETDWQQLENTNQLDKTAADIITILENNGVKSSLQKRDELLENIKDVCDSRLYTLLSEKIKHVEKIKTCIQGKYGPIYTGYALWYNWDDHHIAYYHLEPHYLGSSKSESGFIWSEKDMVDELSEFIEKWGTCSLPRDDEKYSIIDDFDKDTKMKKSDLDGVEFLAPLLVITDKDLRYSYF